MSGKGSFLKLFGWLLIIGICFGIYGLISIVKTNYGESPYIVTFLEAMIVVIVLTSAKWLIAPPLSLLTGIWKSIFYFSLAIFVIGGVMIPLHDKLVGWILFLSGMLAIFVLNYRFDLMIRIVIEESKLHMGNRLKMAGIISVAIFLLLVITQGIANLTTWLMTIFWFCTVIGYMTIKSKMAELVNFIPGGATRADRKAFFEHFEKNKTYSREEMISRQIEMDVEMAVHAKNSRAFLATILFLLSYYIFSVFVGFSTVTYYVYYGIKQKRLTV